MPVLSVQHVTTYQYRRAVGFGEHRMMVRPRDSFDQRVVAWNLAISPEPSMLRSLPDAFGNIVTVAQFTRRARELRVENRLVIDHTPTRPEGSQFAPYARHWPFTYDLDDRVDLGRVMQRHYHDPEHKVDAWARSLLANAGTATFDLLRAITLEIRHNFTYCPRYEEGVQEPTRTLALRAGTCRDYAVLMIEAVRALGMAARFVTGYIYSPASETKINHGSGATHAWVEVFIPGAGWIEFDPTNGIIGSRDLIRVASVRDAHQAVPLAGTWTGFPADNLGMSVCVHVTADTSASTVSSGAPDAIPPARMVQNADQTAASSEIVQLASRGKAAPQSVASHPSQTRCAAEGSRNR